jgi:hypothetical protein
VDETGSGSCSVPVLVLMVIQRVPDSRLLLMYRISHNKNCLNKYIYLKYSSSFKYASL